MKRHATRVADLLNPAALLMPASNVIMQLSLPGVGYGVLESPVDSGNVYKHPSKRARTTGTYLAAATVGTESDRALIRAAVDVAHRQVRSTSSSPVSYNAFDPKLQLWVASCLYRYYVDQHELLHGPLDEAVADAVYHDAKRGAVQGLDTVFIFEVGGLRIAHLGDLGHSLTDQQISAIGSVDVVLVPVGGGETIDAQEAIHVVDQIRPRLMVIPMHYKTDAVTIKDLAPIDPFITGPGRPNVRYEKSNRVAITGYRYKPSAAIVVLNYK